MFHCANCWLERWQGRSLSDSQQSYNSDVVFMREQVCSSEEVHCGSVRSTAGDSGTSDTRTTLRLYHSIKKEHIDISNISGYTQNFNPKLSGYHADTPITIKAEAIHEADSCIH